MNKNTVNTFDLNVPPVEELEKQGYRIKTIVKRNVVVGDAKCPKFRKLSVREQYKFRNTVVQFLSVDQINELKEKNTPVTYLSRGGHVEVLLISPKGDITVGESKCNWTDNFEYTYGRDKAILRALESINYVVTV